MRLSISKNRLNGWPRPANGTPKPRAGTAASPHRTSQPQVWASTVRAAFRRCARWTPPTPRRVLARNQALDGIAGGHPGRV